MDNATGNLEQTLLEANTRIDAFLTREGPALDPLFAALAEVAAFLPVEAPTPAQTLALKQYRKNLEKLQDGVELLSGRLWSERTSLQAQRENLRAARAYQQCRVL